MLLFGRNVKSRRVNYCPRRRHIQCGSPFSLDKIEHSRGNERRGRVSALGVVFRENLSHFFHVPWAHVVARKSLSRITTRTFMKNYHQCWRWRVWKRFVSLLLGTRSVWAIPRRRFLFIRTEKRFDFTRWTHRFSSFMVHFVRKINAHQSNYF